MKVINFGSLNVDYVYQIKHIVQAGETVMARRFNRYPGGKGLNQSIALARAGAQVIHAGLIGSEGTFLKAYLANNDVEVRFIRQVDGPSGHALIQVDKHGENSIIVASGANHQFNTDFVNDTLQIAKPNDILLLQNEINDIPKILETARAHDLFITYNISPANTLAKHYPLHLVDMFILNRNEAKILLHQTDPDKIYAKLLEYNPKARLLFTMGELGARFYEPNSCTSVKAYPTKPVDTTACSDTFVGYFLANWIQDEAIEACLNMAAKASALSIAKAGAATSIPFLNEVESAY